MDATTETHGPAKTRKVEQRLDSFTRLPFFHGLKITSHSNLDYPPHEAIIRRAIKTPADLVIVATRTRGLTGRLLLRNTDWELIRQCPCPLLLVKSPRANAKSVVLVAVDPFHTHSKPVNLDKRLLDFGGAITRLFKGSLHAFHAYMPLVDFAPIPGAAVMPVGLPPEVEESRGVDRRRVQSDRERRRCTASGPAPSHGNRVQRALRHRQEHSGKHGSHGDNIAFSVSSSLHRQHSRSGSRQAHLRRIGPEATRIPVER